MLTWYAGGLAFAVIQAAFAVNVVAMVVAMAAGLFNVHTPRNIYCRAAAVLPCCISEIVGTVGIFEPHNTTGHMTAAANADSGSSRQQYRHDVHVQVIFRFVMKF